MSKYKVTGRAGVTFFWVCVIFSVLAVIVFIAGCSKAQDFTIVEEGNTRPTAHERAVFIPEIINQTEDVIRISPESATRGVVTQADLANKMEDYYLYCSYIPDIGGTSEVFEEGNDIQPWAMDNVSGNAYPDLDRFARIFIDGQQYFVFNSTVANLDFFVAVPLPNWRTGTNYMFEKRDANLDGFVISEAHDDYHIQVPGGSLGELTIFYCSGNGCVDLAIDAVVSQYQVDVIHGTDTLHTSIHLAGEPDFGKFRIYANATEESEFGGYRPQCTSDEFTVAVSSDSAEGYQQCGRIKLNTVPGILDTQCGECYE